VLGNLRLSDFEVDHGLNSIVDTFYQKPEIIGSDEEPNLQQKSSIEALKNLWDNKFFGGSVFEPVKSSGMPALAGKGPSAPVKNAKLQDRPNGLLAAFHSGGWDQRCKFVTLKQV
jgi:hypothetical protein